MFRMKQLFKKKKKKRVLNPSHGTVGQKTLEKNYLMGRSKTLTSYFIPKL